MAVEVTLNTPLAEALSNALPPKLSEFGWSTGGLDDSALGEYIILMLVNGKTQEQIAAELSNDLLALPPEDTGATEFAKWLFEQVDILDNQLNGVPQSQQVQAIPAYQGEILPSIGGRPAETAGDADAVMGDAMDGVQNGTVPTGPKSMRTGSQNGNRRMIGQISKAMDRSSDAALHRVRPQQGTERINKQNRVPPKGPRNEQNRAPRMQPNGRPMGGPAGSMKSASAAGPLAQMSPEQQMQLLHMAQQQAQMMSQLFAPNQQQMFMPGSPAFLNGAPPNQQPGRSLFERVGPQRQDGRYNNRSGAEFQSVKRPTEMIPDGSSGAPNGDISSSIEVESSQNHSQEPSPDTICRFNLKCTKQDCPFAHASPEAPPGTTIDVSDKCPFGAACKNRKCVGRHPSPAQKLGYQTQQECKFFPNCTNPNCPFRHPTTTMPMCKYGADCKMEGCKFTHNKTMCKFNPCTNPNCVYKHAEGQSRGKFRDKVWVADGGEEGHVSERKFVDDEMVDEELVVPDVKLEDIKAESRDQGSQSSSLAAEVLRYLTGLSARNVNHEGTDIAVLGGGITGLASAYFLSRSLPDAKITLFEASSRLGGWLHSKQVDVANGSIVFEQGPRNLRPTAPNGLITLDLVRDLGLEDRLLMTSKGSVAAQNRFIYYPDHLIRMPGPGSSLSQNVSTLWSEPVFDGALLAALMEVTKPQRPEGLYDESIGSFISRRFGSNLADNVVSAVFHGIYAGDIYRLSARTILAGLWQMESRNQSLVKGLLSQAFRGLGPFATNDLEIVREFQRRPPMSDNLEAAKKSSVFTFKGGIGELADQLERKLLESPKVDIRRRTLAKEMILISEATDPKIQIITNAYSDKQTSISHFSHAISTIAGDKLSLITAKSSTGDLWPSLGQTGTVTVMVVNLFFPNPDVLPVRGFGYLLPRSIPLEQNPERALGVVFDSDASIGQDDVSGTKVTVMLGGHWWDDFDTYPDEDEGASMARTVLRRHLGIVEEPRVVRVSLQHDCIPQYRVGHDKRMADASRVLKDWKGRLRVAGNSYTGVGLNDCVRAARDVVKGLVDDTGKTGLDSFVGGKPWSWVKAEDLKIH